MAKKNRLAIVVVLVLAAASVLWYTNSMPKQKTVKIGQTEIPVELAVSAAEKTRGLSYRQALAEDSGLLFVYDKPGYRSFWMKDMHFPIDIIWIDAEANIIGIERNVPPESYPQTYHPAEPAQYVLEVNAGFADGHGFEPGQKVELPADLPL